MTSAMRLSSLAAALALFCPGTAGAAEDVKQLQYYLLIDDSGSMAFPTQQGKFPAADTHRSAIVAVRAFSSLLTDDDKLQVIPLNQGKALFHRPAKPFTLKQKNLLDEHLGPASPISHYAGPLTPCGRALKVLAKQLDEHAKDDSVKPVVLFMTDGDCVGESNERLKSAGAWSRGKAWRDRLAFYIVTFKGRVKLDKPLFTYPKEFRGGGDTLQIGSSADLLPYFAQVIAAARGKTYLHPKPGSDERIGRAGGGPVQDLAEGFVGAEWVQMVLLAEAEAGQTWDDLGLKLEGLESQQEIKPTKTVVPDVFQYDHSGLKDEYLGGLKRAGFKNAANKLKCDPGPCKRFISAVVTFSLDPKNFEPGEKVKISLKAKTWSALQLAKYDIDRGDVPIYLATGGQCGELPLDPAAQKLTFEPGKTVCLELSPEAKSAGGGGISILDPSMKDAFDEPAWELKRVTRDENGNSVEFPVDQRLSPEGDRWIVSLPNCPEGHHTLKGSLVWGAPGSRIPLDLGDLRVFECKNRKVDCAYSEGGTQLAVGAIPAGTTTTVSVTCKSTESSLIGIKGVAGEQLDKMPDCLDINLVGAKDGFKKLPPGGEATNLQIAFRARPFCHGDVENPAFDGNLQLHLKDGSDPAGNRNFQVDGNVKFKLSFAPEPITAELRQAATGSVKVEADIGAPFYFKLYSKTEAAVNDDDPQVREARWVVRSTDVDHPERFKLKPGATSFDYLLTPGRCCSAAGDMLPLMLQPVTKEGKAYGAPVTLEVPATVAGSFLTCWLPTLIYWLLCALGIAFVLWFLGGYYRLFFSRSFHFKRKKSPTARWIVSDVSEDVVAFCNDMEGHPSHKLEKCKVKAIWRFLPHPAAHGRCNRAILGGPPKGVFAKCYVARKLRRVPIQAVLYPKSNGRTFDVEIVSKGVKSWSLNQATQEIEYTDLPVGQIMPGMSSIRLKIRNYHFVIKQ